MVVYPQKKGCGSPLTISFYSLSCTLIQDSTQERRRRNHKMNCKTEELLNKDLGNTLGKHRCYELKHNPGKVPRF